MCNNFYHLNFWAIVVSTFIYFFIGALWYSPILFAQAWMKESKVVPDKSKSHTGLFIGTFFITMFMVSILAFFISATGVKEFWQGILVGLLEGLGFAATTLGITFLYEGRSIKLFLIDAGYHLVGLTVAGTILGLWR